MDGNFNDNVICCFCGEQLLLKDAAILTVKPNIKNEEKQQLFCHKDHFVNKIHKAIYLHADFFSEALEENDDSQDEG